MNVKGTLTTKNSEKIVMQTPTTDQNATAGADTHKTLHEPPMASKSQEKEMLDEETQEVFMSNNHVPIFSFGEYRFHRARDLAARITFSFNHTRFSNTCCNLHPNNRYIYQMEPAKKKDPIALGKALVAATTKAQTDRDSAPLAAALSEALAANLPPKCAAAVRARKLLESLEKEKAVTNLQK